MRGARHSRLAWLISRIRRLISIGTFGRPPRERDFQRQYKRKPTRCHRMIVSGCTMAMAFSADGKQAIEQHEEQSVRCPSFGFDGTLRRRTFN
jgi:hypothetical protein